MDRKALAWLPFFISQRGDSGQNQIPAARMKEGMKAEPSWSRHAMRPVSLTMTLAQKPKKIPKNDQYGRGGPEMIDIPATTHNCQNMTKAPRIRAGAISAE